MSFEVFFFSVWLYQQLHLLIVPNVSVYFSFFKYIGLKYLIPVSQPAKKLHSGKGRILFSLTSVYINISSSNTKKDILCTLFGLCGVFMLGKTELTCL